MRYDLLSFGRSCCIKDVSGGFSFVTPERVAAAYVNRISQDGTVFRDVSNGKPC